MDNDGENPGATPSANHEMYESFMAVTKWGVILVTLALLLMAVFLV